MRSRKLRERGASLERWAAGGRSCTAFRDALDYEWKYII
jgi:hypothetical protein